MSELDKAIPNPSRAILEPIVKLILNRLGILRDQALIFSILGCLILLTFGAVGTEGWLKSFLMCAGVLLLFCGLGVYVYGELRGLPRPGAEEAAAEQLPRVIKQHRERTTRRPAIKRPPRNQRGLNPATTAAEQILAATLPTNPGFAGNHQ